MTQKELADEVGVTRQTIIAIEKGHYAPSLELAFLIARAFDRSVEEVFYIKKERAETVSKSHSSSGRL